MIGIKYEDLETGRAGHGSRDEAGRLDPAPPLRMGPQRCLSSRETIERLATAAPGLLPTEPHQVERTRREQSDSGRTGGLAEVVGGRPYLKRAATGRYFTSDAREPSRTRDQDCEWGGLVDVR